MRIWITLGALWISLNFLLPQISFTQQVGPFEGRRALYPFFNWHLFTITGEREPRFSLMIEKCDGQIKDPLVDALKGVPMNLDIASPLMMFRRVDYIGHLVLKGNVERARFLLRRLIATNLPHLARCEMAIHTHTMPITALPRRLEETSIAP